MELYGLNCVDLVVSYTIQFIFITKKCKFSKKKGGGGIIYIPSEAFNGQTATLRKML